MRGADSGGADGGGGGGGGGGGSAVHLPEDATREAATLNRYAVGTGAPRPESWREDMATAAAAPAAQRARLFSELAACAESGWDFSSRFLGGAGGAAAEEGAADPLHRLRTSEVVPVEVLAPCPRPHDPQRQPASPTATSPHRLPPPPAPHHPPLAPPSARGPWRARRAASRARAARRQLNAILYRGERALQRMHARLARLLGASAVQFECAA